LFGIMKRVRTKIWFVLAALVAIGLVLVWAEVHRPTASGKEWILLSAPSVRSRTNSGAAMPMVTFRVSNVGPRSVHFMVSWFECRDKRDRTLLATNQLHLEYIPLPPGKSISLTTDVSLAAAPVEDCLCCYQVQWFQREAPVRRAVNSVGRWWFDLFALKWESPWPSEHLVNGTALAANLEVAEYFRQMYGFTRAQWLEDLALLQRLQSHPTQPEYAARRSRVPTAEEYVTGTARGAFIAFCQASNNSARDAEPIAPPNAAPPHR
jgi:hypothetical protein